MLLFFVAYENTSGPLAWIYATETTIDAALGSCLMTLWGTVFVLSIVCPILMTDPPHGIGPSNTFYMLAGTQVLGTLYCYFFMKETMGLTDKEKKNLYAPNPEAGSQVGQSLMEDRLNPSEAIKADQYELK